MDGLERVQRRVTKTDKGMRRMTNEERLRKLGLFSLEKRRFREDVATMFQYLKDGCKEDGDSIFPMSHKEKTRGNRCKLLLRIQKLQLDTRENPFIM